MDIEVRIQNAINSLHFPDRMALSCVICVKPADLDEEFPFEEENQVLDQWKVESESDAFVAVEVAVISHVPELGQGQYDRIQASISECADVFCIPGGKKPVHWVIEQLINQNRLSSARSFAINRGYGSQFVGPHLFGEIRAALPQLPQELLEYTKLLPKGFLMQQLKTSDKTLKEMIVAGELRVHPNDHPNVSPRKREIRVVMDDLVEYEIGLPTRLKEELTKFKKQKRQQTGAKPE